MTTNCFYLQNWETSLLSLLQTPSLYCHGFMRNLQFTMSNVDGYTIYMHIGCLNCPEFLLPPILSNVKPTSETPSLDNSTVLNTQSCVGACPQSQVGPLSARLCHRTRPSWNCRRFVDTLDQYHHPNFALPFQNTFWISELLAVAKW